MVVDMRQMMASMEEAMKLQNRARAERRAEKAAQEKNFSLSPYTIIPIEAFILSLLSTAIPCRNRCWKVNYSAMKADLLPARKKMENPDCLSRPIMAQSS